MVNIGTKNLHYLVKHKSSRSHRSWLETLQFFTAELPRAQARVSTVQANWIQTRSQGRESGDWTMTGQLIHKSYSQSSHLPTARCMSGNEVENTCKSSQIFLPVVFPVCTDVLSQWDLSIGIHHSSTNEGLGTYFLILINLGHDLGYQKLTL